MAIRQTNWAAVQSSASDAGANLNKVAFVGACQIAYIASFPYMYGLVGAGFSSLIAVSIIAAALLFGTTAALVAWIIGIGINVILFNTIVGMDALNFLSSEGFYIASQTLIAVGFGALNNLRKKYAREADAAAEKHQLDELLKMARSNGFEQSFKKRMSDFLGDIARLSGVQSAVLWMPHEDGKTLREVASFTAKGHRFSVSSSLPIDGTITGETFLKKQITIINDYASHKLKDSQNVDRGMRSVLSIPLTKGDEVYGIINLASVESDHFTPERIRIVSAVVNNLAPAVSWQTRSALDTVFSKKIVSIPAPHLGTYLILGLMGSLYAAIATSLQGRLLSADGWVDFPQAFFFFLVPVLAGGAGLMGWRSLSRNYSPSWFGSSHWLAGVLPYLVSILAGSGARWAVIIFFLGISPVGGRYFLTSLLVIGLALLLSAFFSALFRSFIQKINSQERLLGDKIEELKRSREQIIVSEQALRSQVAEFLHGRVQSRLLIAWSALDKYEEIADSDPEKAKAIIGQIKKDIEDLQQHEVREASHLLHPSIIKIGLLPALRSLVERYQKVQKVNIIVDRDVEELDNPTTEGIPEDIRFSTYRIIEEALSNTGKHARASLVEIGLSLSMEGFIELTVKDDGVGFDPGLVEPGLGLNSIASRVEHLHGTWHIASAVNHGTTITVHIPISIRKVERSPVLREAVLAGR